jgi:Kef-type K+ transport system membrane component KefB
MLKSVLASFAFFVASAVPVFASTEESGGGHGGAGILFLFLAILLIASKIGGIIQKWGQPAVIGEIGAGIFLSFLAFSGLSFIDGIRHSETIAFIAELGAVLLLFQIGLETNIKKMTKVGASAVMVAIIGVVVPFVLGSFVVGPLLFPDSTFAARLFIGASLVATSVGITAYVFREMKVIKDKFAQVVLRSSY